MNPAFSFVHSVSNEGLIIPYASESGVILQPQIDNFVSPPDDRFHLEILKSRTSITAMQWI
jgi:hypothetical protein